VVNGGINHQGYKGARMQILLMRTSGFIGRRLQAALLAESNHLVCTKRASAPMTCIAYHARRQLS